MGGGLRSLLAIACLTFVPGLARADATRVSIDWQGVRDRDIERCGLSRLRAGTIERLVSEGYALVASVDGSGVEVAIQSSSQGLTIRAALGEIERRAELRPGEPCDATFVLEVIARVAELVEEVAGARPSPSAPGQQQLEPSPVTQPEDEVAATRFVAALDLGARANQALSWLLGGGVSARAAFASGLQIGGRADLGANSRLDVNVVELGAALTAAYHPSGQWLGPYAELGPVLHVASSDARSVSELDAMLGAGVQLSAGHFLGQLLVYGRLGSFQHRVAGEIAHDSGRIGLALRLGAQL